MCNKIMSVDAIRKSYPFATKYSTKYTPSIHVVIFVSSQSFVYLGEGRHWVLEQDLKNVRINVIGLKWSVNMKKVFGI